MNKEKKLVPELRFPDFENNKQWDYLNGDELFEPISNKNHNSDLPILAITQEQGAIPRDMIDYHVSVSDKSVESYKVVEVGDFIISLRSFQGGIEYSNYLGLCSPAYIVLRKKLDVLNDFYRHYFKSFLFIQDLNRNLEGIRDGKMISYKQFSDVLIPRPKKQEQQKIAACLSSLDELIAANNDKLEALKDQKKGLMQNLFPQEGQKVPDYRFPEFEKDGEWVDKRLEKTCEVNPRVDELPDEFVYIDLESVSNGLLLKRNIVKKTGAPSRAQRLLQDQDVIYQTVRPYQKNNYYFIDSDGYPYVASTGYAHLRAFDSSSFLFQLIHTDRFVSSVLERCTGSNYPAINSSALKQIEVQIPPTKSEQQKIASCLSALDELIKTQSEKIEQLQQHKKGLLQSLFPKTEK